MRQFQIDPETVCYLDYDSYSSLTSRQLSSQRVGLASPDNSDTRNAGRGPVSTRPRDCASARPARPARQSYKLHIGGTGGGLEIA